MIKPLPLTVEQHLAAVSYGNDVAYVPSEFAADFVTFIKLVNGTEGESHLTPVVHFHMLDTIVGKKAKIINMCHRGMAKTTVMGEYLFLYLGVFGKIPGFGQVDLALYVSDSIENGVKNMRKNLEFRWENSEFLKQQIPNVRFTDVRWEFNNVDGKRFIVKGYGAKTGVRGAKEMGKRPQLAVLDDLVSDEDARSATVIDAIEATVNKAVNFALDPARNKTIWSGTPFNSRDPLYKAVESGAWETNVFPVCEKFPVDEKDFNGSWPDRFPYSYVKEQYDFAVAQGKPADFNQELMLRIMSAEDRMVQDSDIRWFCRADIMRNKSAYNFYITTDFATSEKTASDYSVISVWAYNANGDWLLIDGVCRRQLMNKNIDDLFRFCQKYKPESVGVEVSGQQGGFVSWIQSEMGTKNIWFTLASDNNSGTPGIRPNGDKMKRFNTVLPLFKQGKIMFPLEGKETPLVREAIEELSLVSAGGFKSKHDDWADTASMLSVMNAWKPSNTPMMAADEDNIYHDDEPQADDYMNSYLAC